jgi:hypothetical protein
VTFRLDCPGPLEGFLAEATAAGTLRGYTKKKILDDFDGLGTPKDPAVLGKSGTFEVIRSVPGSILASGAVAVAFGRRYAVAAGLDAYFAQSLQRRVRTAVVSAAGDDGVPTFARGLLVECPPDGDVAAFEAVVEVFESGAARKALAAADAWNGYDFLKANCHLFTAACVCGILPGERGFRRLLGGGIASIGRLEDLLAESLNDRRGIAWCPVRRGKVDFRYRLTIEKKWSLSFL